LGGLRGFEGDVGVIREIWGRWGKIWEKV